METYCKPYMFGLGEDALERNLRSLWMPFGGLLKYLNPTIYCPPQAETPWKESSADCFGQLSQDPETNEAKKSHTSF